ncbi:uncharacterized protein [Drosophila tropicalis]|uniref:uncharacterized protein n=1 Tax=Drosophila tropicalis TaxID=46794 RepID=UPI0035ABF631
MSRPVFVSQVSTDPFVPAWLDQKELEHVIAQDVPEFQKIESISSRSEQSALRVLVQAKLRSNVLRTLNYLVKSPAASKADELIVPFEKNFKVEFLMHDKILPALEELYKDVGKNIVFTPHRSSLQSRNCLYLEYLQSKGYRLASQPNGLAQPAMEIVLSKLAAYHAATARYLEANPAQIRELPKLEENPKSSNDRVKKLKSLLQTKFHESLRSNNVREYEDKVKSYQNSLNENNETLDVKTSFNVILNGSCWPNNLLYNGDAFGHIKEILFIDFHYSKYGPAVYDLLNLLLTAPAEKSRYFDANVKYYHDQLIDNLKALKFRGKLPTLTELQLDLLKFGHWAFEVSTEILPIVLSEFHTNDIDELFKGSKFSQEIQELLPWLENRGYFEED